MNFLNSDLVNLDKRNIYVSMSIDGQTSIPFSAQSLNLPTPQYDHSQAIIEHSRRMFSKDRSDVEAIISDWSGASNQPAKDNQDKPGHSNAQAHQPSPHQHNRPEINGVEPKKYSELIKSQSGQKQTGNNRNRRRRRK